MVSNRLIIAVALSSSLVLAGCDSLLYSGKLAPVYSKTSSNNPPPPLGVPATTEVGSIERPQGEDGIVVNSEQNNPYGNPAGPYRPSEAMTSPDLNDGIEKTNPYGSSQKVDGSSASLENTGLTDPRVREASEVLGENSLNDTKPISDVERPTSVVRPPQVSSKKSEELNVNDKTDAVVNNANQTANTTTTVVKPVSQQSATKALLQEARQSVEGGNYDKAASALERAHRIEPGNAKILYDIAQIRFAQGKHRQAESFASKAANYSASPVLSKKIWMLLSSSRKALGNNTGAQAAAKKAASY